MNYLLEVKKKILFLNEINKIYSSTLNYNFIYTTRNYSQVCVSMNITPIKTKTKT